MRLSEVPKRKTKFHKDLRQAAAKPSTPSWASIAEALQHLTYPKIILAALSKHTLNLFRSDIWYECHRCMLLTCICAFNAFNIVYFYLSINLIGALLACGFFSSEGYLYQRRSQSWSLESDSVSESERRYHDCKTLVHVSTYTCKYMHLVTL